MPPIDDAHNIDQTYRGFRPFADWAPVQFNQTRWGDLRTRIEALSDSDDQTLSRARRIARRAAAFESGAIENLYESDRGLTMTIATEAAEWENAVNDTRHPQIVHDQLDAYEGLLDLATEAVPITEAGIRELHTRLCQSQETYLVHTPTGPQQQTLRHGEYKSHPNHVLKSDDTYHAYAPVDMTAPEMQRLCGELRSADFSAAHPILQAAYSHHALTVIHPFADGNGRVARAIASIFLYKDARIPFLFFIDQRTLYFDALGSADRGDYIPWIEFVSEAGLQTMLLVEQTVRSARPPAVADSLSTINTLYVTKGGYSHDEIDNGAKSLLTILYEVVKEHFDHNFNSNGLSYTLRIHKVTHSTIPDGYRVPLSKSKSFSASITNERPPANATHGIQLSVFVPKDAESKDSFLLWDHNNNAIAFEARVDELIPNASTSVSIRVRAFGEGLVNEMAAQLAENARKAASKF